MKFIPELVDTIKKHFANAADTRIKARNRRFTPITVTAKHHLQETTPFT